VKLVFVSTGNPLMARDFQETLGFEAPIWVDTRRETYKHLGFKRGVFATLFHPSALMNGLRALSKGFRQGRNQGDVWQQGGVVVVGGDGEAVYAFASAAAGDHPPTELVVTQARQAANAR
jgi:hypothetical protein